ncbi:hypothetical protein Pcinc_011057 [Petrolisthes cinctipes]|uniref:RING-type E3 ubiquitin transferase n=1 Tax=Petrolisthes cinctipes TaxID=88211 RepID=A0AAE1G4A0_PETCI|nr:hypothetical protein Pcinc_011057 [Petrolisthes cinctipes]
MATARAPTASDSTHSDNNSSSNPSGGGAEGGGDDVPDNSNFECNICLDTAKDAVISMCGHLFCWPCLHQWLETRPNHQTCPVCKAAISRDKVIPLYGRGSGNQQDPRDKLPPRPSGQRTEPEPQGGFMPGLGLGEAGGFQFHFGIGAFPFGIFTTFNNWGGAAAVPPEMERELPQLLQYVLLILAFFFYWNLFFG